MIAAGAVLAGGASRRMGRTKALIKVDGRTMADRAIDALRLAGVVDVVVVGGDPVELAGLSASTIDDAYPGEGPLGGVLTALRHFGDAECVVVLSCDLPDVTADVVRQLLNEASAGGVDVSVAATDRVEPMCAAWRQHARPRIQAAFDAGDRAVHEIIAALDSVEVSVDSQALLNVNTPEDLSPVGSVAMAIEEISVADLHALGPDITLLDVREDNEWADGHVAYAQHVSLGSIPDNLEAFSGTPTYVVCKVGGRSFQACEFAAAQGRDVVNVAGGMLAWADAGFEIVG